MSLKPYERPSKREANVYTRNIRAMEENQFAIDPARCYINRLPFEILSEIFVLAQKKEKSDGLHRYVEYFSLEHAPLNLLSICKFWRAVALGTSSLWNAIRTSYSSLPCMTFWLKVAPEVPFRLRIEFDEGLYRELHYRTLHLFATVPHRWQSLSLKLHPRMAGELLSILQNATKNWVLLQELKLEFMEFFPRNTDLISNIIAVLPSLPFLKHLDWDFHRSREFRFDPQLIPWSKFQVIKFTYQMTTQQVFFCLMQCTSATSINFQCPWYDKEDQLLRPSDAIDGHPFILPLLTDLTLSNVGPDSTRLLEYFSLPSLRNLHIRVSRPNVLMLSSFLERTPPLATLMITIDSGNDEDSLGYLIDANLRNIPYLVLCMDDAEDRALNMMRQYPDIIKTLPSLTCWMIAEEGLRKFRYVMAIGWDKTSNANCDWDVFWYYKDGKVNFSPIYGPSSKTEFKMFI